MAIIKNKEKSLNRKNNNSWFVEFIGILMCIAAIPVYAFFRNIYTSFVIILVAFAVIIHFSKKRKIYKAGIQGEKEIAKLLDSLNNRYLVYNDIVIGGKERGAQIDHLVLSPYGIFCIETKNMKGVIMGKEEDREWTQIKGVQGGKNYEKKFYNPCKQSAGHANAVKNILRHSDFINTPVYSIVTFSSNKNTNLKVQVHSTPVIKSDKLIDFINKKKEIFISDDKLRRIENIIDKQIC
ncbi:nuclease-related domain-containing protein [Clostridium pasteurianum]|uniref:nuclease-related domain-containing protein n=1 Tax=Clostridium pasteurianum TaxID=1501 RepID=UPI0005A172EC|nr:nuclease-related domain-containing protein [Clostridium pasteurianum]